jgi:hypothetical protein
MRIEAKIKHRAPEEIDELLMHQNSLSKKKGP